MTVENLLKRNNTNIKDMQVDLVESPPTYNARQLYESLKQSELYDGEKQLWNYLMDESQNLRVPNKFLFDQFAGILVEGVFNKKEARKRYDALKQTPLYDVNEKTWRRFTKDDRAVTKPECSTGDFLLHILVEGLFDTESAREQYDALKKADSSGSSYNTENQLWYKYKTPHTEIELKPPHHASDQLLGVIIEGMFDKNKAEERYRALTEMPLTHNFSLHELYDAQRKQWNPAINTFESKQMQISLASDQLLGVLALGIFNKKEANLQYNALKKTVLYDPVYKQWNKSMEDDQLLLSSDRLTFYQLLGVWAEHMFETEKPEYAESIEQLPKMRRF